MVLLSGPASWKTPGIGCVSLEMKMICIFRFVENGFEVVRVSSIENLITTYTYIRILHV